MTNDPLQPELERSPKTRRLSNGSRASSTSGSTSTGSPGTDKDDEPEEEEEEEAAPAGTAAVDRLFEIFGSHVKPIDLFFFFLTSPVRVPTVVLL